MVRRVGFGDETPARGEEKAEPYEEPRSMSVADRAMERFRKKARLEKARDAQAKETRGRRLKRAAFLFLWLVVWVAMAGTMIFALASEGLGTNILPLVIITAASVFVISRVIGRLAGLFRPDADRSAPEDHF